MDDHLIDDIIFNIHQQILDEEEARRRPINGDLSDESHRLEAGIREKLAGIGFKVKEEGV